MAWGVLGFQGEGGKESLCRKQPGKNYSGCYSGEPLPAVGHRASWKENQGIGEGPAKIPVRLPFLFLPNLRDLPAGWQIIADMEELWGTEVWGLSRQSHLIHNRAAELRGWKRRREGSRKRRCVCLTQLIPNAVSNINTLVRRYCSSLSFT